MLKHLYEISYLLITGPAAFRRLCVETLSAQYSAIISRPAAFRRLCVETFLTISRDEKNFPAAFRRLCVETGNKM